MTHLLTRTGRPAGPLALGAALLLAMPAMAWQEEKPVQAAPPADMPSAHSLVEKSLEAMGGRKNLEKIKSMESKATMDFPDAGMTIDFQIYSGENGQFLMRQVMSGMGEASTGFDGKVAWAQNPMSGVYTLLGEEQLVQGRQQAGMHQVFLNLEENSTKTETVGREAFRERDAWKVLAEDEHGQTHLYFDVEDGMPLGLTRESPQQGMTTYAFGDWETFGDVKLFKKMSIRQRGAGMEMEMIFESFTFNEVDPAVFELPADVKALVKEREADKVTTKPEKTGEKEEEGAGGGG